MIRHSAQEHVELPDERKEEGLEVGEAHLGRRARLDRIPQRNVACCGGCRLVKRFV